MKIVLAEEPNGSQPSEKTFGQPIVRIGRDPLECQITFDNAKYPMVSRRHAELRWEGGKWFLYDLNSSYGTFVNGQRVSGSQTVAVGSVLQFGTQGPSVRVLFMESADAPQPAVQQAPQPVQPTQFQHSQQAPPQQSAPQGAPNAPVAAQLDFVESKIHSAPFKLTKSQI